MYGLRKPFIALIWPTIRVSYSIKSEREKMLKERTQKRERIVHMRAGTY